jgi:hypothetical protein
LSICCADSGTVGGHWHNSFPHLPQAKEANNMGKILILSVTDHEEHILNKIMETIANEPKLNHIAPPLPCNILSFKNLEIRLKEQTVSCRDQLVTLTHHEFAVLTYLARHPGWVFSASQIYEAVWDRDGEHCGTAVASVIGQIRRKLTPDTPKGGYIRTVPGSGYKFESVI